MASLVVEGAHRRFDGIGAVNGVDLAVEAGEVLCLLGPSGCGKTTTLRLVAGLEAADAGCITIDGEVVDGDGAFRAPEARGVGLVFQDFALFPHLDVRGNVEFGVSGKAPGERRHSTDELLERVNLSGQGHAFPHTLSGGEQQRVALARALAPGPSVMLLDEPFSGLDFRLRDQVGEQTLALLRELGTATVMVTHDSDEAMRLGDRIALMDLGRIVQHGAPEALYQHPASEFVAKFFSEINTLEGVVRQESVETELGPVATPDHADGARVTVGLRPEALQLEPDGPSPGPGGVAASVLSARNMGPYDLIWLKVAQGSAKYLARVAPGMSPEPGAEIAVRIGTGGSFVFAGE